MGVVTPQRCTTATCGKLIFFAVTEAGKRMPVDYDSAGAEGGTLAVRDDGGVMRCRVLNPPATPLQPGEHRGTSHYVTCARPADHRRPPARP
jgi:hypothetical protein